MKKSLLAIAVAAALPVVAQAQVTLYGKMDLGVGSIDRGGTAKSIMTVDTAIAQTSRLGIRGTEKMTGGLNAIFQIEGGVTADTGAAITFNRESWVGLNGGFGDIRLGRTLTPSFHADALGDIMGYSYFGGQGNWSSGGSGACAIQGTPTTGAPSSAGTVGCGSATPGAYSTRFSNGINWTSPSMSGLVVRAAYAFSERDGTTATTATTTPNSVDQAFDIAALYSAGPLGVALGYQDQKLKLGDNNAGSRKVTTLAGSYQIGSITLKGGWATSEQGTGSTTLDLSKVNLGAGMKVGAGMLMLTYSMYEADAGAGETAVKREANVLGLAYNHPLSKNTSLYATYGRTDNKNAVSGYGLWAGGVSYSQQANGVDSSGLGFGVIHNF